MHTKNIYGLTHRYVCKNLPTMLGKGLKQNIKKIKRWRNWKT